ncbi:hypothetical protein T439DRAFT_329039 [Meredithblackwellia eburnea MCA 4105]
MDPSSQLLSLLNMGAPAAKSPPSQPQKASSPSTSTLAFPSAYATPLPSSANSIHSVTNPPSDLERIFGPNYANLRKTHDSSPGSDAVPSPTEPGTTTSGDAGVRRSVSSTSATTNGHNSRGSENGQTVIEKPAQTDGNPSTQSRSLLHLLQTMNPPHPDAPSTSITPDSSNPLVPGAPVFEAPPPPIASQQRPLDGSDLLARLMPGGFRDSAVVTTTPSPPTSVPPPPPPQPQSLTSSSSMNSNLTATQSIATAQARPPTPYSATPPSSLLDKMSGSPHRSSPLGPRNALPSSPSHNSANKASPVASGVTQTTPTPPPPSHSPFNFISPFDVLSKSSGDPSHVLSEKRMDQTSTDTDGPSENGVAVRLQSQAIMDALFSPPPHNINSAPGFPTSVPVPLPTRAPVTSGTPTSGAPSPSQAPSLHSNTTIEDSNSFATAPSQERPFLAWNHLSSDFSQPFWAPTGNDINTAQGTLRIDITQEPGSRLDPNMAQITPITLFQLQSNWEKGIKVGAWEKGLCYGTKHGKVRVIDRMSGSKLLLKGQSVGVIDLAVAPSPQISIFEGKDHAVRTIASVGRDNKLLVWQSPEEFGVNDPGYQRIVEIQGDSAVGNTPRFQFVRFHPQFPLVPLLALAQNDGKVRFVDLSNPKLVNAGLSGEKLLDEVSTLAHSGPGVVDFSFSPDGTAFAVLSSDATLTLHQTVEPSEQARTLRLPDNPADLSCLAFISAPNARPTAIAVSSCRGTSIRLVSLGNSPFDFPAFEFSTLPPSPDLEEQANYSHMAYHQESRTLFLSNSLRGSLFALRLSFNAGREVVLSEEQDDDFGLLAVLPSSAPLPAPTIDHLTEIATPELLISFIIDDFTSQHDDGAIPTSDKLSAICTHPGGVHQVTFNHKRCPENEFKSPVMGGSRRMSLEGSIHVQSEVVVEVDEGATGEMVVIDRVRSRSITSVKREPSVADIAEEDSEFPIVREDAAPPETSLEAGLFPNPAAPTAVAPSSPSTRDIKLAGPVVNAAIKSMKAKIPKTASPSTPHLEERTIKVESPDPVANAWATGNAGGVARKANKSNAEATAEVLREIKKLEESLPGKIGKAIQKEMDKHAQRYDEDRAVDQAAHTSQQETMLKLVSTTLTKNTSKLVESTIKEQIQSQVIPAVGQFVQSAVSDQISRGVEAALAESLPKEIENLLFRNEITSQLTRKLTTTLAPALERNLASAITKNVIPSVSAELTSGIEGVITLVRQEMVDVRKEIVQEQSGALEVTEQEVGELRMDVRDLKAQLVRMEALLSKLSIGATAAASPRQPSSTTASVPAVSSTGARGAAVSVPVAPATIAADQQPSSYTLPPIPRPTTPLEQYEDMFTNALQPEHEPEFASLLYLIHGAPPTRLEAMFPSTARGGRNALSGAVVLSLAFRLSQVVGWKTGPYDEDLKVELQWLRKCLQSMDGRDSATQPYIPRIIESAIASLGKRYRHLMDIQKDSDGAEAVKNVLSYARNRLGAFA